MPTTASLLLMCAPAGKGNCTVIAYEQCMLLQIGSAEQYAQAGDVILSPEVAAVAAGLCTVDALESNDARLVSMSQQAVVSACASVCSCITLHSMLMQKSMFNACLVSGMCVNFACSLHICTALCSFVMMQVCPGMKLLSVHETERLLHQVLCKWVRKLSAHTICRASITPSLSLDTIQGCIYTGCPAPDLGVHMHMLTYQLKLVLVR